MIEGITGFLTALMRLIALLLRIIAVVSPTTEA